MSIDKLKEWWDEGDHEWLPPSEEKRLFKQHLCDKFRDTEVIQPNEGVSKKVKSTFWIIKWLFHEGYLNEGPKRGMMNHMEYITKFLEGHKSEFRHLTYDELYEIFWLCINAR